VIGLWHCTIVCNGNTDLNGDEVITVILNAFKRKQYLKRQIECVFSQTVPVDRVLIWNNGEELDLYGYGERVMIANNSHNLGVWSRFAYAVNAETEYICVLDDDTFPAPRFFESCLKHMEREPALLGARGLRFLSATRYHPFVSFGWDAPNEKAEVVDIVGHAWFFKREWLGAFWQELPLLGTSRLVGEDMHFSFMLQKYLGIRTMVTPHPESDREIWGSDPVLAIKLGTSKEAVSQGDEALRNFDAALAHCTRNGFRLWKDISDNAPAAVVIGPGITRIKFIKRLAVKYPLLGSCGRYLQRKLAKKNIHI
jgi:glycosyltransferase involved in cell wall biosynthesis